MRRLLVRLIEKTVAFEIVALSQWPRTAVVGGEWQLASGNWRVANGE